MVMAILPEERILSVIDALIGLLVGSSVMYWIGAFAEKALGKEALGQGDVKLMGCIGAFCGWKASVFVIFAGASIGTALVIPFMVFQFLGKKPSKQNPSGKITFLGGGKSHLVHTSPLPPFFTWVV